MQQQQQQQQGRPPAEAPVEPSVLESRQAQLQAAPLHWFQAVGVSFDGRQGLIAQLNQGQAVAFVREPDNPHDPHAVSVRTLDDKKLGYIARDETQHFPQASAGAASWLTELCYRADS
jgi:hypothetical protein